MDKRKFIGRIFTTLLALVTVAVLMGTLACTPQQVELIEGILGDVDSVNGEITIVTKDGKTVTLKIATETQVATEGASSDVGALEPGAAVTVEVKDDRQVAQNIKARQAEVEGVIILIVGSEVTVETERGTKQTLVIADTTRIELEDDFWGTIADLQVGTEVEAKFDPTTRLAFKIEVKEREDEEEDKDKDRETARVGWGIIEIRVTDPPPANVKSAVVYLSNIEVHRVSGNTSQWLPIIGAPLSFDLMDVIGVEQVLGSANITAGKFTQIRMDVTQVVGETTDNVSYVAEVPGDKLRIVRPFNVGGGTKTVLTLDFDGEKSLIRTGEGKFLFKPVVKLLVNQGSEADERKGKSGEADERTGKPATTGNTTGPRGAETKGGEGKQP